MITAISDQFTTPSSDEIWSLKSLTSDDKPATSSSRLARLFSREE